MDSRALREALRKQGIFVHESDPVLDVAAICELAMADTLKAIEGMVKAAADRTSAASCQAIEAAKTNSEAVVTQGAAFIVGQFRETVREATATMLAELRQETIRAEHASRMAVRAAWVAGSIGAIVLAGIAGVFLADWHHG
jgi:hypothetical protein